MPLTISMIATVYNEGENITRLLNSMQRQTRQPHEIIIVDGGSSDNTVALMQPYREQLPLTVIEEAGANISRGRNAAAAHANGDVLVITDAGVTLPDDWLEHITRPFEQPDPPGVVAGFFRADPHTVFEVAMGATVLPLKAEIDPATFLPSSRSVAVKRDAFNAIEGYPEWLDYCEDLIFDLRLKANQRFAFAPKACAAFRPRGSLAAFFKQYYLYARGDGKADLWRKRHAIRYLTYLVAAPAVIILGVMMHPAWWLLFVPGAIYYTYQPYRRLPQIMAIYRAQHAVGAGDWMYAVLLVPVIRVVGDVAKMLGYPAGWRWRLREHPPQWRL